MVSKIKAKVPHNKKDISNLPKKERDRIIKKREADLKYRQERRRLDKEEREQKPPEEWTRKGPEQEKRKQAALKKAQAEKQKPANEANKDLLKTLRGVMTEDRKRKRKETSDRKKLNKEHKKLDRKWAKEIKEEEEERESSEYEIIEIRSNSNSKFTTHFDTYKVKIKNVFRDPADIFIDCVKKSIDKYKIQPGDKFRLILQHGDWYKPFSTKLITVPNGDLTRKLIEKAIMFAEYKSVPIDELLIEVQTIKIPRGSGIKPTTKANIRNGKKRCMIPIKNNDSMCLARAIVTGHANNNPSVWTRTQLKDGFCKSRKLQKEQALLLHKNANVDELSSGNTFEDCDKFAKHLGVTIRIFSADSESIDLKSPAHISNVENSTKIINLYKENNHFSVIKSLTAFTGFSYYCNYCNLGYTKRDKHKCPQKYNRCFSYKCEKNNKREIFCTDCNRAFRNQGCYDNHKKDRRIFKDMGKPDIVCEQTQKCLECKRLVKSLKGHICGYDECNNCKKYCDPRNHKCYMTRKETKGGECTRIKENGDMTCCEKTPNRKFKKTWCLCCQTRTTKYLYVDFEARQETTYSNGYKKDSKNNGDNKDNKDRLPHEVNYAHIETHDGCKTSYKTIDEFCNDLVMHYDGYTVIAHNGSGYDFKFIQAWFVRNGYTPKIITKGSKIMYMSISQTFKGTIHIPAKLSKFPEIFGLNEKKKGYFPNFFNKKENENYIGKIPDRKYYGPDYMSVSERKKFMKWHSERVKENYEFNFQKEMKEYCESDVSILAEGMKTYRKDFLELCNIDPLQYITIAGACINTYRNKFMPEKKIAVFKDVKEETHSLESIRWLKWLKERDCVQIKHANNGDEHIIEGVGKVDGFCEKTNTAYEYQGCFWHGCKKCYPDRYLANPVNNLEMHVLKEKTDEKNKNIINAGCNLVEVWECDLRNNSAFTKWKKENNIEVVTALNPRDSFFGGRTNITKLLYEFQKGEYGAYKDVVSLYPTTNLKKRYPVGHPIKLYEQEEYNGEWFGLIKCKMVPPRGLYHPVLPMKTRCGDADKLLFQLCKTCAENHYQGTCNHTNDKRSIIGTWCTPEIKVVLEKGYKIKKIYEVWHFQETTEDLFAEYVRTFAKLKIESSKEPKTGPGHKYKSLDDFRKKVWERDGIKIGEIKENPGKRQIAKLCLNSLRGKFGQRVNMSHDIYTNAPKEFYDKILDNTLDDLCITFMSEDIVHMNYKVKDKFADNYNNVNIFIASFTTSHARCTLYSVLDKLGDRVLGYDTDCAWYIIRKDGKDPIESGDMLGDLTDELSGGKIVDWVGSGPKSYSYKSVGGSDGDENVCKMKGFTLNFSASQKINMDSMKEIVRGDVKKIIIERDNITRDDTTLDVITEKQSKTCSLVYDKRVIQSNYDTLPYGY